ncbi:MAG: L,D-transpeptidase family protein [Ignavibacteria bacterium]|nr:L,D-transpeptidase family protein [Ignavibacteria bacterium]
MHKIQEEADSEKLFFETTDIGSSDAVITDHLLEQFPIISEKEINRIILTKTISQEQSVSDTQDSTLISASETLYKVSFEVPKNYLADTVKILWHLNIPGFESKIYQLYNNEQIYIDTWPNVVGTAGTKTYTGNFEAYKIRNWPFYKDPDPSKADLPPTKPGPGNPLGLFVVHYDQNSLRYFHGTNKNNLLNSKMRNLSHGCVRNDNDNIEKMKQFIIKRVVKSEDLSSWLKSKKTLIYDFEEIDKFPVQITYKTFDIDKDESGDYIILYKDIYNYSNPDKINAELNDTSLIILSSRENIAAEYQKKFGTELPVETLNMMIDYVINKGVFYDKFYIEDLKQTFMVQN